MKRLAVAVLVVLAIPGVLAAWWAWCECQANRARSITPSQFP